MLGVGLLGAGVGSGRRISCLFSTGFFKSSDSQRRGDVVCENKIQLGLDQLSRVDDLSGSGFRIENPNTPALLENPIAARVQRLLEEQINPSIAAHGGQVTLVGLHEDKVYLRFGGGCQGCGMADVTLKEGIVKLLQQEIPEITEVLDETDHEAGENPYDRAGGA